jgi:DNA polymerase-3 subunit delta'
MSLDGVVGHRELIAGLLGELARRPSHAYLLAGPRGVGKASVALGLAHSILCERSPGAGFCCTPENCATRAASASAGHPPRVGAAAAPRCECCAGCVQAATGVHPDFILVARNPNRTEVLIEQVRDLIERLGLRPARAPRRIAIIDDAQALNLSAQNALLKTLEEPPGRAILFLITDSERALLDTVRSRTRPVRFGPLEPAEIARVISRRAGLEPARAEAVARLARGSVARALALAGGDEPPVGELVAAIGNAQAIDFAAAQGLAQDFFGTREAAADNFELIARLIEEMLCFKLLGAPLTAPSSEAAQAMAETAGRLDAATLATLLAAALEAAEAVDGMANSRLQAEQWWMKAGAAIQGAERG